MHSRSLCNLPCAHKERKTSKKDCKVVTRADEHLAVVGEDAVDLRLHVSHLRVDCSAETCAGLHQLAHVVQQLYEPRLQGGQTQSCSAIKPLFCLYRFTSPSQRPCTLHVRAEEYLTCKTGQPDLPDRACIHTQSAILDGRRSQVSSIALPSTDLLAHRKTSPYIGYSRKGRQC